MVPKVLTGSQSFYVKAKVGFQHLFKYNHHDLFNLRNSRLGQRRQEVHRFRQHIIFIKSRPLPSENRRRTADAGLNNNCHL